MIQRKSPAPEALSPLTIKTAEPDLNKDGTHAIKLKTSGGASFLLPLGPCSGSTVVEIQNFMVGREIAHPEATLPEALNDVSAEFVVVTPRMAIEWLATNHTNRGLSWSRVNKYARVMAQGQWKPTGEAIQFDHNGRLTDGQNRLWAVIKSGATIIFLVVRGLDPASQAVINQPLTRSPGAWAAYDPRFKGIHIGTLAPICREIMILGTGYMNLFGPEIVEAVGIMYKRELLAMASFIKQDRQRRGQGYHVLSRGVVLAAAVLALRKFPKETVSFLDTLVSGPSKKGSATNILFSYLYKDKTKDTRRQGIAPDTSREILLKTLWAFNAHRDGKKGIQAIPKANDAALLPYLTKGDRGSILPKGLDWTSYVKSGSSSDKLSKSIISPERRVAITAFLEMKGSETFSSKEMAENLGLDPKKMGGLFSSLSRSGLIERVDGTKDAWRAMA